MPITDGEGMQRKVTSKKDPGEKTCLLVIQHTYMENGPVINDLPMYIYVCIYIYTLKTIAILHTVAVAMLRG